MGACQVSISHLVEADTALGSQIPLDADFASMFGLLLGRTAALETRVGGKSLTSNGVTAKDLTGKAPFQVTLLSREVWLNLR